MRFAGILEAGRVDGILVESQYVQGTYIVVKDIPARTDLELNFGVLTFGTVCYVQSENKEYRWVPNNKNYKVPSNEDDNSYLKEGHWEYIGTGITTQYFKDDYIYGLQSKDGKEATWVKIDAKYIKQLLKDNDLDLEELNTRVENLEDNVENIKEEVDKNTDTVNQYTNTVKNLENKFKDVQTDFDDLRDDVTQTNQRINDLDDKLNSSINDLNTSIDNIKTSPVGSFKGNDLVYGEDWAQTIEENIEIPYATEERVGGITAAPPDKNPEVLNEPGKSGWIRYFVSVGKEENEAQNPNLHYGYIDVNPSEAVLDVEILKRTLKDNPEVIEETITPVITEVNGNTEGWWEKE